MLLVSLFRGYLRQVFEDFHVFDNVQTILRRKSRTDDSGCASGCIAEFMPGIRIPIDLTGESRMPVEQGHKPVQNLLSQIAFRSKHETMIELCGGVPKLRRIILRIANVKGSVALTHRTKQLI